MSSKLINRGKLPLFRSQGFPFHGDGFHFNSTSILDRVDQLFDFSNDINFHSNFVEVSVPGFSDKDITIHLDNGTITVKGERKTEYSTSSVNKTFSIPNGFDPEKVEAKLENGMLTLTFSELKAPDTKEAKQIPINSK